MKLTKNGHFHAFELSYFISSWMNALFTWKETMLKESKQTNKKRCAVFTLASSCTAHKHCATRKKEEKKQNKNNIIFIILAFNRTNGLIALCYVLLRRVLFTALGCLIQFSMVKSSTKLSAIRRFHSIASELRSFLLLCVSAPKILLLLCSFHINIYILCAICM